MFEEKLCERIVIQLKKAVKKSKAAGKWPSWLIKGGIRLGNIIKGRGFLCLHGVKMDRDKENPNDLIAQLDVEYSGGAGVRLLTTLRVGSILECPVEIVVKLLHLRAPLYLYMPGDFSERFSLMFEKLPWDSVDFSVECYVSRHRFPVIDLSGVIAKFAHVCGSFYPPFSFFILTSCFLNSRLYCDL